MKLEVKQNFLTEFMPQCSNVLASVRPNMAEMLRSADFALIVVAFCFCLFINQNHVQHVIRTAKPVGKQLKCPPPLPPIIFKLNLVGLFFGKVFLHFRPTPPPSSHGWCRCRRSDVRDMHENATFCIKPPLADAIGSGAVGCKLSKIRLACSLSLRLLPTPTRRMCCYFYPCMPSALGAPASATCDSVCVIPVRRNDIQVMGEPFLLTQFRTPSPRLCPYTEAVHRKLQ